MFSDEELEAIEAILEQSAHLWVETTRDQYHVDSILEKIDKHLNG